MTLKSCTFIFPARPLCCLIRPYVPSLPLICPSSSYVCFWLVIPHSTVPSRLSFCLQYFRRFLYFSPLHISEVNIFFFVPLKPPTSLPLQSLLSHSSSPQPIRSILLNHYHQHLLSHTRSLTVLAFIHPVFPSSSSFSCFTDLFFYSPRNYFLISTFFPSWQCRNNKLSQIYNTIHSTVPC